MINKILIQLEGLKSDFSYEKAEETIKSIEELGVDELLGSEQFLVVINEQHPDFYEVLSLSFINDLNEFPEMYFLFWEHFMGCFDDAVKNLFFDLSVKSVMPGVALDYVYGIKFLNDEQPEMALIHFSNIADNVSLYFVALCYLDLKNFENAIKMHTLFLQEFMEMAVNGKIEDDSGVIIAEWNVCRDLAYCYNAISDYGKAYLSYQKALKIFTIQETFDVLYDEQNDEFFPLINGVLLACEKTGQYEMGLQLIDFAIAKYPLDSYFSVLESKFRLGLKNVSTGVGYIQQLYRDRKPYGINSFSSTKLIAREKALEDMIVEQIKYGFKVFGKNLEIYQDNSIFGRQYYIQACKGILDLLLIDKSTDQVYVVELKRNNSGVEVVAQIENYIAGLKDVFKKPLLGIICVHKADSDLVELVKIKVDIELFTYEFDFSKLA